MYGAQSVIFTYQYYYVLSWMSIRQTEKKRIDKDLSCTHENFELEKNTILKINR